MANLEIFLKILLLLFVFTFWLTNERPITQDEFSHNHTLSSSLDQFRTDLTEGFRKIEGRKQWTPLHFASFDGNQTAVDDLLANGSVSLKARNKAGEMALHLAAFKGHATIVQSLIYATWQTEEISISDLIEAETEARKWTPLFYAAISNASSPEIVKTVVELVENGSANVEHRDINGMQAAHVAVTIGRLDVLRTLLSHNSKLSQSTACSGKTLSHFAAENNVVRFLTEFSDFFDASQQDDLGQNVACWAAIRGSLEFGQQMVDMSIPINGGKCVCFDEAKNKSLPCSPLQAAAYYDHRSYVELIVNQSGESVRPLIDTPSVSALGHVLDMQDRRGRTPVHYLAMRCTLLGVEPVGKDLVPHFSTTQDLVDIFGETPVEIAIKRNCIDLVRLFLTNSSISCRHQNRNGYTLLHVAKRLGFDRLVDAMISSGNNNCSLDQEDACGIPVRNVSDPPTVDRCGQVPLIENGTFNVSVISPFCIGSKLEFTCDSGFEVHGSNVIACSDTGKWRIKGYCAEMLQNRTTMPLSVSKAPCRPGFKKLACGKCIPDLKALEDLQRRLLKAGAEGNATKVRELLGLGVIDVDWRDEKEWTNCSGVLFKKATALHLATACNHSNETTLELTEVLLKHGASINVTEDSGLKKKSKEKKAKSDGEEGNLKKDKKKKKKTGDGETSLDDATANSTSAEGEHGSLSSLSKEDKKKKEKENGEENGKSKDKKKKKSEVKEETKPGESEVGEGKDLENEHENGDKKDLTASDGDEEGDGSSKSVSKEGKKKKEKDEESEKSKDKKKKKSKAKQEKKSDESEEGEEKDLENEHTISGKKNLTASDGDEEGDGNGKNVSKEGKKKKEKDEKSKKSKDKQEKRTSDKSEGGEEKELENEQETDGEAKSKGKKNITVSDDKGEEGEEMKNGTLAGNDEQSSTVNHDKTTTVGESGEETETLSTTATPRGTTEDEETNEAAQGSEEKHEEEEKKDSSTESEDSESSK